jgi:hypothetical protein
MLYHGVTSTPWSMLGLVLVLLLFSFGAFVWLKRSRNEDHLGVGAP